MVNKSDVRMTVARECDIVDIEGILEYEWTKWQMRVWDKYETWDMRYEIWVVSCRYITYPLRLGLDNFKKIYPSITNIVDKIV